MTLAMAPVPPAYEAFVKDFTARGVPHLVAKGHVIYGPVVAALIPMSDAVYVTGLVASPRHHGHGTAFLRGLCEAADRARVPLRLVASPIGLEHDDTRYEYEQRRLRRWYSYFGFRAVLQSSDTMLRKPFAGIGACGRIACPSCIDGQMWCANCYNHSDQCDCAFPGYQI